MQENGILQTRSELVSLIGKKARIHSNSHEFKTCSKIMLRWLLSLNELVERLLKEGLGWLCDGPTYCVAGDYATGKYEWKKYDRYIEMSFWQDDALGPQGKKLFNGQKPKPLTSAQRDYISGLIASLYQDGVHIQSCHYEYRLCFRIYVSRRNGAPVKELPCEQDDLP